ncbi:unnamed protein product [Dovyalis caffra]|uniref:Uncharacterized protein n=1 Tax=Dovyalis caffra TaxID=77055 RepID=A0AAV1RGH5_9ROSI|nr:unnamed protein product [Dovyalis caffra]
MCTQSQIGKTPLTVLIDSSSNHNFLHHRFVKLAGLRSVPSGLLNVVVANGGHLVLMRVVVYKKENSKRHEQTGEGRQAESVVCSINSRGPLNLLQKELRQDCQSKDEQLKQLAAVGKGSMLLQNFEWLRYAVLTDTTEGVSQQEVVMQPNLEDLVTVLINHIFLPYSGTNGCNAWA